MIAVDVTSPVPVFEQLRVQIAGEVRSGRLSGGTRLPSVRQLAADLDIAPGTVAKAFTALEAEGLVTTSRAMGTRVAPGAGLDESLRSSIRAVVKNAEDERVSLDAVLCAVRAEWNAAGVVGSWFSHS